jgi:hypothetical protein
MTSPTHPLARLKEAAIAWIRSTRVGHRSEAFRLSMLVTQDDQVVDIRLRPEDAIEDLRYEIAEWSSPDVSRGQPVEVLGRASSMDGAKALLEAEHARAPGKVLVLRHGARVIDKRGTEPDGGR